MTSEQIVEVLDSQATPRFAFVRTMPRKAGLYAVRDRLHVGPGKLMHLGAVQVGDTVGEWAMWFDDHHEIAGPLPIDIDESKHEIIGPPMQLIPIDDSESYA